MNGKSKDRHTASHLAENMSSIEMNNVKSSVTKTFLITSVGLVGWGSVLKKFAIIYQPLSGQALFPIKENAFYGFITFIFAFDSC